MRLASTPLRLGFSIVALAALAAQACAEGNTPGARDGTSRGDGPSGVPDAGVSGGDAGAARATMRLAHLAHDLGAVDFCWRDAKAASFEGPALARGSGGKKDGGDDAGDAAAAPDASDGGSGPAPTYASASTYRTLDVAGPLTIAIVEAGASSCASPVFVGDVTLDPGKLSTVAVLGRRGSDAGDALGLVAYTDDRHTEAQKARVRVVHAALAGTAAPIAVRAVGASAALITERVEPKRSSTASATIPVDVLGYATIAPIPPPASLTITPAAGEDGGASWQSASGDLGLAGGSLHTAFVLTGAPYEILWCADTNTSGETVDCRIVR